MNELFSLFGLPVTAFGLGSAAAMLALLLGMGVMLRRRGLGYGVLVRYAVLALPLTLVCARLIFVLADCTYFLFTLNSPLPALYFWDGGYSLMGALMGAILAAPLAGRWCKVSRAVLLDAVGLGAPLAIFVERLSEMGTGMGFGRNIRTDWLRPFGIADDLGSIGHCVWGYEAAVAIVLFIALLIWAMRSKTIRSGDVLLVFMTIFGCTQVLLESLRNDNHLIVHFVRIQQIIAMVLPVIALGIFTARALKKGIKKSQAIIVWLVTIAAIVMGVVQEFAVDSSANLWFDYGIMALCLAIIAYVTLNMRRLAEKT